LDIATTTIEITVRTVTELFLNSSIWRGQGKRWKCEFARSFGMPRPQYVDDWFLIRCLLNTLCGWAGITIIHYCSRTLATQSFAEFTNE